MKKTCIFLFLLVFSSMTLFAKTNLVNGYIITNSNDTIYGQIDLRPSKVNQERCTFITHENEELTFYPGEIQAYKFIDAGRYYVSKEISIEGKQQNIFAEYLVQGLLNLFYFVNNNGQSYFLFEEEGKDHFYITQAPEQQIDLKLRKDTKYLGLLSYYFQDSSPIITNQIRKTKFNQSSMIKIVKLYNDENCISPDDACIVFENKSPDESGLKVKFSAYTGLQNITYNDPNFEKSSVFPLIGTQVFIYNPEYTKAFGVLADFSFSKKKDDVVLKSKNRIEYDLYSFTAKLGVRYSYGQAKLRPSIEAGPAYTSLIGDNAELIYYVEDIENRKYKLMKSHIGGYIGAGLEYNIRKQQFLFLRFNYDFYGKSDSTQENGDSYINLWQIKLGYAF